MSNTNTNETNLFTNALDYVAERTQRMRTQVKEATKCTGNALIGTAELGTGSYLLGAAAADEAINAAAKYMPETKEEAKQMFTTASNSLTNLLDNMNKEDSKQMSLNFNK